MSGTKGAYRTVLVTGASSGIGQALAERLAADGALVVLAARRAELLHAVAEGIEQAGGRARVEPMDVSDTTATVARIRALDVELTEAHGTGTKAGDAAEFDGLRTV